MMHNQEVKENSKKVWGSNPAGWTFGQGHQKGSQEFFESVLNKRFSYECDWMFDVVDFKQFKGKKVLEIGCGAGYDAYQFCKEGADYTGIDITPDNPVITKKHLSFYGFAPTVMEMDVEKMSFEHQFDYIFSFGVLHHVPDIKQALCNIHKTLKNNGEFQIIVYYKNSLYYRINLMLYEWILKGQFLRMSRTERLSLVEYTQSGVKPLVRVYSAKELHNLLNECGFTVVKTDIRKLVHEDLPGIPFVMKLYRYIPQSWLNFLGKKCGWYISVKCTKK